MSQVQQPPPDQPRRVFIFCVCYARACVCVLRVMFVLHVLCVMFVLRACVVVCGVFIFGVFSIN